MTAADIVVTGERRLFIADDCTVDHGVVTATGRWLTKTGRNHTDHALGDRVRRSWHIARLLEIRWRTP